MKPNLLSAAAALLLLGIPAVSSAQVKLSETKTTIPTYLVGNPETDPYFFTGRAYQGAAGHVYPYPIYDILTDERVDRDYKYLILENEYTQIGVLPEIGGRIFSAVDRQTGYNFFYRQHVIRPALIGMIGSWISGGVEWNVPHHHRASSTLNAGYELVENADGSKTVWVGETELRQRLKWSIGLTMFPGKSYVEATFEIQNRTPMMQSFLYWANVAVHANENYQVNFPPQTVYGTTHSKTNYSDWPYTAAAGSKEPWDTSWWKNWKGSNSTFAVNYSQEFFAGYDFGQEAGVVHFANHHVVPGKKFFLWGTDSVWNEMLTEEDGAYLEVMVGTFSDNQPDYSWIGPNEVRVTKQYWYPIKKIGGVKNATLEAAVNVVRKDPTTVMVGYNATSLYKGARLLVKAGGAVIADRTLDIDPDTPFLEDFTIPSAVKDSDIFTGLYDADGTELVSYSPVVKDEVERPHPADRPKTNPSDYETVEELLLAGQRLEEFHNARLDPLPYYEEALKRDPQNARVNVNLGIYYARRARWEEAEGYLQNAYQRLTGLHYMPEIDKTGAIYQTNPKDGEMLYYLGVVSRALGKNAEAETYFWKSTWYPGFQSASFRYLAELYWINGERGKAMEAIDNSLDLSGKSTVSRFIKSFFLSEQGRTSDAKALLEKNIAFDPLDFLSRIELARLNGDDAALGKAFKHMGIPLQEVLEASTYYGGVGAYKQAVWLLDRAIALGTPYASTPMQKNAVEPFTASPLLDYMAGWYTAQAGDREGALARYRRAAVMSPDYCFPFRDEEKRMLEDVIAANPSDSKAPYYLGNLLYYYDQKDAAIDAWKQSSALNPNYGMVWRNLGFAANRHLNDKKAAEEYYRKAIAANSSDPKFFTEYDILSEAVGTPSKDRLAFLDKNRKTVFGSDDATARLVHLYVENGKYDDALNILNNRHFRVWEGGQTVYTQFVDAHLLRGLGQLSKNRAAKALEDFQAAGTFPSNLETNELSTGPTVAKVAYHQGLAYEALGQADKAREAFEKCIRTAGGRVDESKYFVAMAQKKLGLTEESEKSVNEMQEYIDRLLKQSGASSVIDIYSKFGSDGNASTIMARNIYLQGLVDLARGNKASARDNFTRSLDISSSNVWAKYFLSASK
ncbi:MAG: DUF5107 domain-containing protein [Bacteroidales bacterium]|nr:DUF5107 domain-containing protein [Bacteroidales bacterium]